MIEKNHVEPAKDFTPHAGSPSTDAGYGSDSTGSQELRTEIVACDAGDPLVVETACRTLGCGSRVFTSHTAWLEHWNASRAGSEASEPDVVVLVGSSLVVVGNDLISAARKRLVDTKVLAVLTDPSFGSASAAIKQGVHAVAPFVTDQQSLAIEIRWLIDSARSTLPIRRENAACRTRYATLTQAELDVLRAMLDGKANKQIADLLSIGLRTVELRRSKIMRKMGAGNLAQLIRFVCQALGPACTNLIGRDSGRIA